MAEAAGLALGVLGVTALFSTCVEAFDIIISAKDCTKEYKQLSALVGRSWIQERESLIVPNLCTIGLLDALFLHCAGPIANSANERLLAGRSTTCTIPDMGRRSRPYIG